MSWLTDWFTGGIDKTISTIGETVDRFVTTDKERMELTNNLKFEVMKFKKDALEMLAKYDAEVTERLRIDMASDSWLSKNIRPLTLAFMIGATVLLAYLSIFSLLTDTQAASLDKWIDIMENIDTTIIMFYFGSRGIEKVAKIRK